MTQVGAQGLLAFVYSAMICKVQDPCPHSAAPYNALQRERIHPHHIMGWAGLTRRSKRHECRIPGHLLATGLTNGSLAMSQKTTPPPSKPAQRSILPRQDDFLESCPASRHYLCSNMLVQDRKVRRMIYTPRGQCANER
jgi:hypothetical protein